MSSGSETPDAPTVEILKFLKVSGQPYMHASSLEETNGICRVYRS